MASTTPINFYEQEKHIRGPQTSFPLPWSFNSLLKNILQQEERLIGIKSLASEPVGSDEDHKEIWKMSLCQA
jgi:hypothetical protein